MVFRTRKPTSRFVGDTVQRLVGRHPLLRRLAMSLLARLQLRLLGGHKCPETIALLRRCRRDVESLLSGNEAFMLHQLAGAQSRLGGAMAEVGVYQGGSARLLCEAKGDCALHLFDTFAGLPVPDGVERRVFHPGQFGARLSEVAALLAGYRDVHLHPGLFPATASGLADERFCFVHLDVDLNASTRAGLEFFYRRMLPGGIILTHDYSMIAGVARAFHDFLHDKPERVIELSTTQAMVIRAA